MLEDDAVGESGGPRRTTNVSTFIRPSTRSSQGFKKATWNQSSIKALVLRCGAT